MDSIETLGSGMELSNDQLSKIFRCGNSGGMRRSLTTNTLVMVSDPFKAFYHDRWIDDVFHCTGMGLRGDQTLSGTQNRTLAESGTNGVNVHLFEVHKPTVYTYVGEVFLAHAPYQEEQADVDGLLRSVWVFPLASKDGRPPAVPAEALAELQKVEVRQARKLSDAELSERANQSGRAKVGVRYATVKQYQRSAYVAEEAKRRARGKCELCKQPAPFNDKAHEPYLETHHIIWLARGGADKPENTVALCPNCHRRMHILDAVADVKTLQIAAKCGDA